MQTDVTGIIEADGQDGFDAYLAAGVGDAFDYDLREDGSVMVGAVDTDTGLIVSEDILDQFTNSPENTQRNVPFTEEGFFLV